MRWLIILLLSVTALDDIRSEGLNPYLYDLKCEHLKVPLGVDEAHPRLSWKIMDDAQGVTQTAYQLIVGTDSLGVVQGKGDFWDSKRVKSSSTLIRYHGKELTPFTRYYWKIISWSNTGKRYDTDTVGIFETGLMKARWMGHWISDGHDIDYRPAPYFRKTFICKSKNVVAARIYMAAAGLYELSVNGQRISDQYLNPMYTRYDRRTLYVTHDVTDAVVEGGNAIGVLLGNGWYNHQALAVWNFHNAPWRNRPAFCMELHITYEDGSRQIIMSDLGWKTSGGSLVSDNIYTGEHYDARWEQKGWDQFDFDDSSWSGVRYRSAPSDHVVSQLMQPIRLVEEIKPQSMRKLDDSTYLYDLGRNIAGVSKISVSGENGTILRLKHGERLGGDGRVDMSNIDVYYRPKDDSDPFQTDIYILSGNGRETFMPKFNYKGFRYVEVTTSQPLSLHKEDLVAYFMHSDVPAIGKVSSSNPLIDRIIWATNNSYLSNLFGYPTDCPQREKNGWTGDGHFAIETGLFNFDAITVYEKWMDDHRDEQQPNGVLPDIIPTGGWGYGTANGTDWTSTILIIPWNLYLYYGDTKPLEENYEAMKRYVDYVTQISPDGLTRWGRGDWVPVRSRSNLELTSSIYYYVDATILSKVAAILGVDDDQKKYARLAARIRGAINKKFLDTGNAVYASGTQTELSMPLMWGVVPDEYRQRVADRLVERVVRDGNHIDVGVLGAKAILNALHENGYAELAYTLASSKTYPSWGHWVANGATTLLENWDMKAERDISDNHMMFGEIGAWFYKALAGLKIDEQYPGFKHFYVQPNFVHELDSFHVKYNGPQGLIEISWERNENKKIKLIVTVPPNSSATIKLPEMEDKIVQSGRYEFSI